MKKLLLSLGIAAMAGFGFTANADYYLIGGFNNWTTSDSSCLFEAQTDGTFVLNYNGTLSPGFKINDGSWSNDEINFGSNGAQLVVGVPYTMGVGGSTGNIMMSGNIENPRLVLNVADPKAPVLTITGQEAEVILAYAIHGNIFVADSEDWNSVNLIEDSGEWILENQKVYEGSFGIKSLDETTGGQIDWIYSPSSATIVPGTAMECVIQDGENGGNFSVAAGTYDIVFNPGTMTILFTAVSSGDVDPEPTPEVELFVIGGDVDGEEWALGTNQMEYANGVFTWTGSKLASGFKINDGTWSNAEYNFGSNGNALEIGVAYEVGSGDESGNIEFANKVYEVLNPKVEFNLSKKTLTVTGTPVVEEEGTVVDLYLIGANVDGTSWALGTNKMEYANGVYTWKGSVLGSGFKVNNGSWSNATYNIGSSGAQDTLTVGEPFKYTAAGSSSDITFAGGVTEVNDPVVILDLNAGTLLVTDVTGVNTVGAEINAEEVIYNLQGVRVSGDNLSKGIYIINGKKVLVK